MHFKTVPIIGPRYWVSISIASICGANMGDFVQDGLKMTASSGLLMLAFMFGLVVILDQCSKRGNEGFYWLAILIVRAAATELADLGIDRMHASYFILAAGLYVLLIAILALRHMPSSELLANRPPRTDGAYWSAMLTAGTLGTVLGDGIGHMIRPITVGVPISAIIATGAVILTLGLRRRLGIVSAATASYWATIVAIRAWGTNVGDIAAFLLTLPVSMMLSGLLLAGTLIMWRGPRKPTVAATA